MRKKGIVLIFCLVMMIILFISQASFAENNAFTKLGRGSANFLTGWLEIPKNIYEVSSAENPLKGMSWGLAKGFGLGVARTAVGLFEIVTFPFPIPENYAPIMTPEYVLGTE